MIIEQVARRPYVWGQLRTVNLPLEASDVDGPIRIGMDRQR